MKQLLLIFTLFCASCITVNAQTNSWTGAGADNNWNTALNWSLNAVPTPAHDVVIPTANTVNLNVAGSVKSINVNGNSVLEMSNNLTFTNASSVASGATFNWNSSSMFGGTLTVNGTMNLNTASDKYLQGATIINISGTMNLPASCLFYLYSTAQVNNLASGTIDIKSTPIILAADAGSRQLTNMGLLRKSMDSGDSQIQVALTNSGTITVSAGNLIMNSEAKTFNGGVYNVTTGSTLTWGTVINVSGNLTGALNGPINWTGTVSSATMATFNFTGTTQVNWSGGTLSGNGILNNSSTIHLPTGSDKYFQGATVLNNTGLIDFPDNCLFYLYDTAILNNQQTGTIDIKSAPILLAANAGTRHINNLGLLRKSVDTGNSQIQVALTNTGTINVLAGNLTMSSEPKIFNAGIYNVSAGSTMTWGSIINISGSLTGALNGPINWTGTVSSAATAAFNFTGSAQVNWSSGYLLGNGILNNASTIHMSTNSDKYFQGSTVLNNTGLIDFPDNCLFYLYDAVTLNNQENGIIDIKSASIILSANAGTRHFNNVGLLKKSADNGTSEIQTLLTNSGVITVQAGSLNMTSETKTLNGGVYNVSVNSSLGWLTTIQVANTLTGLLNGPINWTGTVSVVETATFNFTGGTQVNWSSGFLLGNGILNNSSTIHMKTGSDKYFQGTTVLNNSGLIDIPDNCLFYFYDAATLNNQQNGVFDIKSAPIILPANAGSYAINNAGLFKKSADAGLSQVRISTTNTGIIDASFGILEFTNESGLNNTVDGIIKGIAAIDLPATTNYTNNGTFSPGGSPGTLTVIGDYKSSTTSGLDVDLFGLVPNTGYDVLAITGNAVFNGIVNVNLSFAPVLNNEFVIATTTGSITQCNLASTTSADFNGMTYAFSVICRNGNQVVLKVTNVTLGVDDLELSESSIQLYPNPVKNILNIKNVTNLELENGSIIDMTGKVISTFDLRNAGLNKEVSMENILSGMYFVKINGLNNSITKRIVKQ